jgi:hypothetical protein
MEMKMSDLKSCFVRRGTGGLSVKRYREYERVRRRTGVKLRVCEELDKVLAVAGDNVVALKVQGYITECFGVAVNIQRSHIVGTATVAVQLFAKEVREV